MPKKKWQESDESTESILKKVKEEFGLNQKKKKKSSVKTDDFKPIGLYLCLPKWLIKELRKDANLAIKDLKVKMPLSLWIHTVLANSMAPYRRPKGEVSITRKYLKEVINL